MQSYKLSQKADADLEAIFNYGIDHFGVDLAVTFYHGLSDTFDKISRNSDIFQQWQKYYLSTKSCL